VHSRQFPLGILEPFNIEEPPLRKFDTDLRVDGEQIETEIDLSPEETPPFMGEIRHTDALAGQI
jgi:hypothetical protein